MINGIKFNVFSDKYSFAGILTEYLKIICFLHKKFIVIPTVIIGKSNGIKEEYMTVMNMKRQTWACYVGKSKYS